MVTLMSGTSGVRRCVRALLYPVILGYVCCAESVDRREGTTVTWYLGAGERTRFLMDPVRVVEEEPRR